MYKYVLCFMFDDDIKDGIKNVVLIEKDHPSFQKGLLNGVGGKIENGEDYMSAVVRTFKKETGVSTFTEDWEHAFDFFYDMVNDNGEWKKECIFVAKCKNSTYYDFATTITSEKIHKVSLDNISQLRSIMVPSTLVMIESCLSNVGSITER